MRRMIFTIAALAVTLLGCGQKSVDDLFKKYSDSEGYVTLTINGNLLKLAELFDDDEDSTDHHGRNSEITQIRILAQEEEYKGGENFFDMVKREIRGDDYEEFMRVKEKDQDLVMLVRTEGTNFREFLLVAGGEDNVIIQIKGKLTMKDARKFSADFRDDHDRNVISWRN
jgi:hypothetical protein